MVHVEFRPATGAGAAQEPPCTSGGTTADVEAIRAVLAAAFARPGAPDEVAPEVALVDDLRAGDAWLPALSLVATGSGGDVVGHVLCTRRRVGQRQRRGVRQLSAYRPALRGRFAYAEPFGGV